MKRDASYLDHEDRTVLLGCQKMSLASFEHHLEDIMHGQHAWSSTMRLVVRKLIEHRPNRGIFNVPVDPVALNIPAYFSIIKNPMDLGTIRDRLASNFYKSHQDVASDVRLVFSNATTFNAVSSFVHTAALKCLEFFEDEYQKFVKDFESRFLAPHSCDVCEGKRCELCGLGCLEFQEPVLRCSSPCKAKIQRNSTYYRLGGDRGQHWCQKCYTQLPERFVAILGQYVNRSDLEERCHNEILREKWISCSVCERKLHRICAMYTDVALVESFVCPICVIETYHIPITLPHVLKSNPSINKDVVTKKIESQSVPASSFAKLLPQCMMGEFIEDEIKAMATQKVSSAFADTLTLRVVSNRKFVTRYEPRVLRWIEAQRKSCGDAYKGCTLSSSFPCRAKSIALFQTIDDVDVLVFVMYVQEYGNQCDAPNRNKVYISYLDSVPYMTHEEMRSIMYKQILVSYMEWVKARGFLDIYIWACPPQRGDAYILHCHPRWQRTPGIDRLRKWYGVIVDQCKRKGVVTSMSNLYKRHLPQFAPLLNTRSSRPRAMSSPNSRHVAAFVQSEIAKHDSHSTHLKLINHPVEDIPYFFGDYLPNEIESMLATLARPVNLDDRRIQSCSDESLRIWWQHVWGSETRARLVDSPVLTQTLKSLSPNLKSMITSVRGPIWQVKPALELDSADVEAGMMTPQQRNEWFMRKLAASVKPLSENFLVLKLRKSGTHADLPVRATLGRFELAGDTSDPDPELPRGIFDGRMEFLDLCKFNNLQFDELRRAKHSSMVLLLLQQLALSSALKNDE